jgi:SAM-dependent methyltransferase
VLEFRTVIALVALLSMLASAQAPARAPDVVYIPTPPDVVDAMLKLAGVKPGDVVYDLGSGDGRIVIMAAEKYGARGVGIDIDPQRVKEARENARRAGVADRVKFVEGDLFDADVSEATVVTLFLLPSLNERLQPKLLKELKPSARIVSHAFYIGDWISDRELIVGGRHVYLWTMANVRAEANRRRVSAVIRPITIEKTYDAVKDEAGWSFITPPVDLNDSTYLQFLDRFRELVFPDVKSHKSWFELFRILRDQRTGEYAFQYRSVEVVGATLAVSVGNVGATATWTNKAEGKTYHLAIQGNQVLFSE